MSAANKNSRVRRDSCTNNHHQSQRIHQRVPHDFARAMPSQRDTIMTRLKRHAGSWITDIPQFKGLILASHYFSLDNHRGGAVEIVDSWYTQDGQEITFKDVPVAKIVQSVERAIKRDVPPEVRTSVYHKILSGMPGHKAIPEWDMKSPESIYTVPFTSYSMPRDESISNQDLFDALAPAAGITLSEARGIGIMVAWWDAMSDGQFGAMMSPGKRVTGGRLGDDHNHTISDVPRNYFRDRLMDWIAEHEKDAEVKQAARKAICPDLTDAEIEAYAQLIAEERKEKEAKDEAEVSRVLTRDEMIQHILEHGGETVRTKGDATKVFLMEEAVEKIDETIDWQRRKRMGIRPRDTIRCSVIMPQCWGRLQSEADIEPDKEIDRSPDQVRAMIKVFLKSFSWDIESLRCALRPSVSRDVFVTFLKKRGTDHHQLKSPAYQLSWEFFNRRLKLGLSIDDVCPRDDMDKVAKRLEDAKRSERERALVAAQEEEKKAQEEKHQAASDALSKVYKDRLDEQDKSFVEQLRALVRDHPRGSPGHSERLRELENEQKKEYKSLRGESEEKKRELDHVQYEESTAMEDLHEKQLADLKEEERLEALRVEEGGALAETQPARLNKRAASGAGGRGRKKARK